ncbi:hypothetical protein JCM10207_004862 [Rhodosporidiobolus poonsookiae]
MADDFDDDLLALAEGTSKRKNKASSGKPSKRRRPADSDSDGSASDMDMSQSDSDAAPSPKSRGRRVKSSAQVDSSDEDEDVEAATEDNPYPLEGIYIDAADKRRIMGLSEIEREDIIGTRKEQMNARALRKQVASMAAASGKTKAVDSDADDDDDDEYATRTTRSRKTTGSSKSKSEGIEKLKQSRAEKGKKKEKKDDSDDEYEEEGSRKKRKSKRDSDMDDDDSDEADSEEDRKKSKVKKSKTVARPSDLRDITVTRTKLAELSPAPWFADWVKGAWVRYSVGPDPKRGNEIQYRICEVIDTQRAQTYRLENGNTDIHLKLKHGKAERLFSMDAVSNSPFTEHEYARLSQTCVSDKVDHIPTPKEANKIKDRLDKQTSYVLTEDDLAAQLKAKGPKLSGAQLKARLMFARDQAAASGDSDKLAELNAQIADFDKPTTDLRETAAKLNERNRLSNREEVRRAEARSQDERRKLLESLAKGEDVKVDASARVKTVPRMNYDSRPHTPTPGTPGGSGRATPVNGAGGASTPAAVAQKKGGKIESTVASRVQIDVDLDF